MLCGCSQEEAEVRPLPENISLDVKICPSAVGSRAALGNIVEEEGEVKELIYAIFKDNVNVLEPTLLTGEDFKKPDGTSYRTGDTYKITNLKPEWFIGGQTEIFVVANPKAERNVLISGKNINDWKDRAVYFRDQNKEARENRNYEVVPTMAGYLMVKSVASPLINVKVEHIYSRIGFTFGWQGSPQSDEVMIDSVKVEHLMFRTKTFNTATEVGGYHPGNSKDMWGTCTIKQTGNEHPFMACAEPKDGASFHLGDKPEMRLTKDTRKQYNVLCRYPRQQDEQPDMTKTPVRHYVYCYQWDGTSLKDDPIVSVYYHFEKKGDMVYKKASAPLYDPNYNPGKRHHGILRNFTYQVHCHLNTTTSKLDLQVTARPWIEHDINDIPAFE